MNVYLETIRDPAARVLLAYLATAFTHAIIFAVLLVGLLCGAR